MFQVLVNFNFILCMQLTSEFCRFGCLLCLLNVIPESHSQSKPRFMRIVTVGAYYKM